MLGKVRKVIMISFLLCMCASNAAAPKLKNQLNGYAIGKELHSFIFSHLKKGDVVIELGSGVSTKLLSQKFKVYSVENDKEFLEKNWDYLNSSDNTKLIYAPIIETSPNRYWYDPEVLKKELPTSSRLVLVDGPHWTIGRYCFIDYLSLFQNTDYIVFDDVHRFEELRLMTEVAKKLGKKYKAYRDGNKTFGVIFLKTK